MLGSPLHGSLIGRGGSPGNSPFIIDRDVSRGTLSMRPVTQPPNFPSGTPVWPPPPPPKPPPPPPPTSPAQSSAPAQPSTNTRVIVDQPQPQPKPPQPSKPPPGPGYRPLLPFLVP
ncbi:hypothetical protein PMIN06_005185 [Paraphaeosphaeria minitans]